MNELRYSLHAICENKVIFPKLKIERQEYAQAVAKTIVILDQYPLSLIEKFEKGITSQVGLRRLDKAKIRSQFYTTRFYIWTLQHPNWTLVLKILSLGMSILFARRGKKIYERNRPLMQLAESVDTLKNAIQSRTQDLIDLERSISHSFSYYQKPPEEWVDKLELLWWNRSAFEENFYNSFRNNLISQASRDLSNPDSYIIEKRYRALTRIYQLMGCNTQLCEIEQDKEIYLQIKRWDQLDAEVQMNLINRMKKTPDRFAPILKRRIEETASALSFEAINKLAPSDRKAIIAQARSLMEGVENCEAVENAYEILRNTVKNKALVECTWSQEEASHFKGFCEDLEMSSDYELALLIYRLGWKEIIKLPRNERRQLIERACFLMEDLQRAQSIGMAFDSLRDSIQKRALKECSWSEGEAAHLKEICEELGLSREFELAQATHLAEKNWPQLPLSVRVENTQQLASNSSYYETELERRRVEVFREAEALDKLTFEQWEYIVNMLRALLTVYKQGCSINLRCVKEQLLSSMTDKDSLRDNERRELFMRKAEIMGLDRKIIEELEGQGLFSNLWNFFKTGKSRNERLAEHVHGNLRTERIELRRIGRPTEIVRVPLKEDLDNLSISPDHLKVPPPSVPQFTGNVDIMELIDHLDAADRQGLIPNTLNMPKDDNTCQAMAKRSVLVPLNNWLQKLSQAKSNDLNERFKLIREILKHYAAQINERLGKCKDKEEVRLIYIEVVDLIGKEMGFAYFSCEDRKYNAAMLIYNEKIAKVDLDDISTEKKVQVWAAKKRDELVTRMLQEMILEGIQKSRIPQDIASSIGNWRYVLRNQLGLGEVPPSQYQCNGGLQEAQILNQFNETYTAAWLIQQAMEEHRKTENGASVMKITAINDLLKSRLSNFEALKFDILNDETYELLDRGMALYLQEAGLFEPIV